MSPASPPPPSVPRRSTSAGLPRPTTWASPAIRSSGARGWAARTFAQIATPTGTTFGDTGLTASTTYSYRVKAVDAATNVSVNFSAVASTTTQAPPDTTPPSDVTGLTATAVSATQINLELGSPPPTMSASPAISVERCQGAGCSTFAPIATPTTNAYPDAGLLSGTSYSYRVKAVDAATNVSVNYSNVASATTQGVADTIPPSDVTGVTATAGSATQINLSWTAATDNGGSGLAGYRVERCQGTGCTTFAQIATPTTNSYSDPGLTASTSYRYRVRAIDGAGNVSLNYSTVASATDRRLRPRRRLRLQ